MSTQSESAWTANARTRRLGLAGLVGLYAALVVGLRLVPWHDAILTPAAVCAAVMLLDRETERARTWLFSTFVFLLLVTNVVLVWRAGYAGRNHVFLGVFPLSDAGEYYEDATRVVHGVRMGPRGSKRPLSIAAYGVVLRVLGGDARATLVAAAGLWASAVSVATAALWRTHGKRAALVAGVVLVMFARRYSGFFQSEGLGAPLGALAFACFWRAAALANGATSHVSTYNRASFTRWYAAGLFLLTAALAARPGPLLLLVAVVAWGAASLGRGSRRQGVVVGVAAIGAALLVAKSVALLTASSGGATDLPAILYGGLLREDHFALTRDYPHVLALSPDARAAAEWRLLGAQVLRAPGAALGSLPRCFASYFYLPQGLFGFVWSNPDDRVLGDEALVRALVADRGVLSPAAHWARELGVGSLVNALAMAALALGFAASFAWGAVRLAGRSAKGPYARLLRYSLSGLFASMCVLPPWITEGAQIHAAAYAFFVATPLVAGLARRDAEGGLASVMPARRAALLSCASAVALLVGVVTATRFPARGGRDPVCGPGGASRAAIDWSTRAHLSPAPPGSDVEVNLELLAPRNPEFVRDVRDAAVRGADLVLAYDYCRSRQVYLLDDRGALAALSGRPREVSVRYERPRPDPLVKLVSVEP